MVCNISRNSEIGFWSYSRIKENGILDLTCVEGKRLGKTQIKVKKVSWKTIILVRRLNTEE